MRIKSLPGIWSRKLTQPGWVTVAGVALILTAGAAYGHFSHRWGPTPDLGVAARRLEAFPKQVGNWHMDEEESMSVGTVRMLECAGYVNRRYVDTSSGESVSIAIIVGPPGPISVHTPEICYSSRNYEISRSREATRLAGPEEDAHVFWNTRFKSRDAMADDLNVLYAWSNGGQWVASKSPRFEFAASPALYKLQIASLQRGPEEGDSTGACIRFLKALLKSGWDLDDRNG